MVPDYRDGNPYQKLLADALEMQGGKIDFDDYPSGLFPLLKLWFKHKKVDVLHIHWIANMLFTATWSENLLIYKLKCFLVFLECHLIRLLGTKVVWTIHNKFAHEGYDRQQELLFRRSLARAASQIIVHSQEALDTIEDLYGMSLSYKSSVIFHGSYIDVYPKVNQAQGQLRKLENIPDAALVIGYFGQIRSYKGVETLINGFNQLSTRSEVYLIIAGKVCSEEYAHSLEKLADSLSIRLKFEFLSEQALVNYIAMTDVVCLPFSDSLTSGSTILAMSCQKALILPESAKIFGCVPESGVKYFHTQEDLKNLMCRLDKVELLKMGRENYQRALTMSWPVVAEKTKASYFN
jgi:glycosyltransferase involved in cell wall biosynthesis